MINLKNLEICFTSAFKSKAKFVAVLIEMEGFEKPEFIVNEYENIQTKLAYYKNTYDEDLNHKFAKGIKIIGCTYGDSFKQIQEDFFPNETTSINQHFSVYNDNNEIIKDIIEELDRQFKGINDVPGENE